MKLLRQPILFGTFATVVVLACVNALAATYPSTILGDNPSAYYRLEETSGSAATDSSINGVSATYTYNSANTYPQLGLPGITTNSILFNGGGFSPDVGFLDIPSSGFITPMQDDGIHGAPFSCELWVQPTGQPATYSVPIEVAQYPKGWNIYVSGADANGGTSYFYLNMPNVIFQGFADFPITFLRWYHLVVTYDGAAVRVYINGVAHGPYAVNYAPANTSNAHVGKGSGIGWTAFIGGVDEVAFYTNVLSLAQVSNHYQVGTNSFRAVPTPPSISSSPASVTNFSGLPATFSVTASGTLPLHYKWLKNGATVGPDSSHYTFTSQYPADDNAAIQVVVTNSFGSATSDVATLTVSTDLIVPKGPDDITRNVGSYAAFRPIAYGAVPITYQWSRSTDGGNHYSPISGATNTMLWLANVQPADSGNMYSVQISNPFNSSNLSAGLTVQARAQNVPLTGYAQIIAADKPVAYWRLNEPDSSLGAIDAVGSFDGNYDVSGTYSFQTPTGIPHWTNDPAVGLSGSGHITVQFAPELNSDTAWSAETWIQPASLGVDGNDYRIILSSEYNLYPNPYNGWYTYQQPNGTIAFVPQPGNGFIVAGPDDPAHGNVFVPNSWYHLVVTDDGTGFYVYLNGKLRASFPVSGIAFIQNGTGVNANGAPGVTPGFGTTVLGQRSDGAFNTFLGKMDETAIYNYALSAGQVQAHYAGTVSLNLKKTGPATVQLTWPVGVLQSATSAAGPYTDVGSAVSPYSHSSSGAPTYYRVRISTQ